ncbi:CDP-glycerol glycerophosphotransferase family protein, partial [Enterococcus innesii]
MIKISDKIEIRTDMDACYLISKTIDLDEVVIVKGNKRKNFIRINTITWKILAIDIAELMNKKQEDRVYIYYGKDMKQFSTDSFEFSFMNSPIMRAFNTEIYVYLTLDNKLRFIWNQHPSAKSYVKSKQISNIE